MLRIFGLCFLFFCAGCCGNGEKQPPPVYGEQEAWAKCKAHLLTVRTEEFFQALNREHRMQTLQMTLPGRLEGLNRVSDREMRADARGALHLAELYLQELTAPDFEQARRFLNLRAEELLEMQFRETAASVRAGKMLVQVLARSRRVSPDAENAYRKACAEYEDAKLEMRTMLGETDDRTEFPPLKGDFLYPAEETHLLTALSRRPELAGCSIFTPEELETSVRAYESGRRRDSVSGDAFRTALLLFRVPRDLYKRELDERTLPEGIRELLTAIAIGAELRLAEEEWREAYRDWETAHLPGDGSAVSVAEQIRAGERLEKTYARFLAAVGGNPEPVPVRERPAEPPAKLLSLLKKVEKYEHE